MRWASPKPIGLRARLQPDKKSKVGSGAHGSAFAQKLRRDRVRRPATVGFTNNSLTFAFAFDADSRLLDSR